MLRIFCFAMLALGLAGCNSGRCTVTGTVTYEDGSPVESGIVIGKATIDGKEVPLVKGKLQLQSEGAEVFYRNITIRPITEVPSSFK